MDKTVSQDTFTFYSHLLAAERDRHPIYEIQQEGDIRDLTMVEKNRQHDLTVSTAREVNMSVSLLPALKKELAAQT